MLQGLLEYDPQKRLTAEQALKHKWFTMEGDKSLNRCFEDLQNEYPLRRVSSDDNDIRPSSLPGSKRTNVDDSLMGSRPSKRLKE
jgi:cyclin-dependent kinase 8/11